VLFPPPAIDFNISSVQCAGQELTLIDATQAAGPIAAYRWGVLPAQTQTGEATQTFTLPDTGDYTIRQVVELQGGCRDSIERVVRIFPQPAFFLPDTFSGCTGKPLLVFADSLENTGANPSYFWEYTDSNGVQFATLQTPGFVRNQPEALPLRLTLTGEGGCTATRSAVIRFQANPSVAFDLSPVSGNVPLQVTATPGNSQADSFVWYFSTTDSLPTQSLVSQNFTYNTEGNFDVLLIGRNANGCTDTARKAVQVLPALVLQWDIALLAVNPDFNTQTGELRLRPTVQNLGNAPVTSMRYAIRVGELTVRDSMRFMVPINPGQVATLELPTQLAVNQFIQPAGVCLEVSHPNGFMDQNPANNSRCATLGDGLRLEGAFPSPFTDELAFRAYVAPETPITLALVNMLGQVVEEWEFTTADGVHDHTLDTRSISRGAYFFRLRTRTQEAVQIVVKQ
jgi:PKD repeat protein